MLQPQTTPRLTEADYLRVERTAEFKSEFFEGEMFARAGGSPEHSLIATNIAGEVRAQLKGKKCIAYNSELRIKVEATGLNTYPDLSVICGPIKFPDGVEDTALNPTVLVEVLSDSTEAYDRGKKFEHYRRIPTLREYLLVSQKEPRIEQFIRQANGRWLLSEASGVDANIELPALGISISLREIFANLQFVPAPIRAASASRAV